MPTPTLTVLERIAQNVLTTLTGVTLAMPDGSTPGLTIRRATASTSPAHLSGVIFQNSADGVEDAPVMTDEWVQQFAVVVYVIPFEGDATTPPDPTPVDAYNNAIIGALYRAIKADYTRGGLAVNTVVQGPLMFPPVAGEYDGVTFNFEVSYRNVTDDPFTPAIQST